MKKAVVDICAIGAIIGGFFLLRHVFGMPKTWFDAAGFLTAYGLLAAVITFTATSLTYVSHGTSGGLGAMLLFFMSIPIAVLAGVFATAFSPGTPHFAVLAPVWFIAAAASFTTVCLSFDSP